MDTLAEFIYEKRTELELTQSAIADKINVTSTYISDIETGKRHPMVRKTLENLAVALECEFEDLYKRAAEATLK